MISTIITLALAGYLGMFFVGFLLGFIVDICTGDWKGLVRDFGFFLVFDSWVLIGIVIGMFTIGNIFNWFIEWRLTGLANPNVLGLICIVICISFNLIGKVLMGKEGRRLLGKEEKKEIEEHKYITLKTGQRVQLY